MTADRQPDDLDHEPNVYAAPSIDFSQPRDDEVGQGGSAALRRAVHERAKTIKRLAWVNLLVALVWLPAAGGSVFFLILTRLRSAGIDFAPSLKLPPSLPTDYQLVLLAVFHVSVFSLNVALMFGLRGLRSWARWTMAALVCAVLILEGLIAYYVPLGGAVNATFLIAGAVLSCGIIYILFSQPSGQVFTREYREAVARTRGMQF